MVVELKQILVGVVFFDSPAIFLFYFGGLPLLFLQVCSLFLLPIVDLHLVEASVEHGLLLEKLVFLFKELLNTVQLADIALPLWRGACAQRSLFLRRCVGQDASQLVN